MPGPLDRDAQLSWSWRLRGPIWAVPDIRSLRTSTFAHVKRGLRDLVVGAWPIAQEEFLVTVLSMGASTPVSEITGAIGEPAWQPDLESNVAEKSGRGFPAHYIARLTQSLLASILNEPRIVQGHSTRNQTTKLTQEAHQ